jgi:hypothetical protein
MARRRRWVVHVKADPLPVMRFAQFAWYSMRKVKMHG